MDEKLLQLLKRFNALLRQRAGVKPDEQQADESETARRVRLALVKAEAKANEKAIAEGKKLPFPPEAEQPPGVFQFDLKGDIDVARSLVNEVMDDIIRDLVVAGIPIASDFRVKFTPIITEALLATGTPGSVQALQSLDFLNADVAFNTSTRQGSIIAARVGNREIEIENEPHFVTRDMQLGQALRAYRALGLLSPGVDSEVARLIGDPQRREDIGLLRGTGILEDTESEAVRLISALREKMPEIMALIRGESDDTLALRMESALEKVKPEQFADGSSAFPSPIPLVPPRTIAGEEREAERLARFGEDQDFKKLFPDQFSVDPDETKAMSNARTIAAQRVEEFQQSIIGSDPNILPERLAQLTDDFVRQAIDSGQYQALIDSELQRIQEVAKQEATTKARTETGAGNLLGEFLFKEGFQPSQFRDDDIFSLEQDIREAGGIPDDFGADIPDFLRAKANEDFLKTSATGGIRRAGVGQEGFDINQRFADLIRPFQEQAFEADPFVDLQEVEGFLRGEPTFTAEQAESFGVVAPGAEGQNPFLPDALNEKLFNLIGQTLGRPELEILPTDIPGQTAGRFDLFPPTLPGLSPFSLSRLETPQIPLEFPDRLETLQFTQEVSGDDLDFQNFLLGRIPQLEGQFNTFVSEARRRREKEIQDSLFARREDPDDPTSRFVGGLRSATGESLTGELALGAARALRQIEPTSPGEFTDFFGGKIKKLKQEFSLLPSTQARVKAQELQDTQKAESDRRRLLGRGGRATFRRI